MSDCDHAVRVVDGYKVTYPPNVENVGECAEGCCSDYHCKVCDKRWRVEWGD